MNILAGIIPWEAGNQNQGRSRKQCRGLKADRTGQAQSKNRQLGPQSQSQS